LRTSRQFNKKCLAEGDTLIFRQIAGRIERSVASVVATWRTWDEEHRTRRSEGSGARSKTTPREDRLLRIMTLRERVRTTRSVADQWYATEGRPIRMRTVYHRLRSMGLTPY
jgi:transposase